MGKEREYIYPRVRSEIGYICRDTVSLSYEVILRLSSILRKKGDDGLYYKVRVNREFSYKDDDRLKENIVSGINHFHMDVYRELILGEIDPGIVNPFDGRQMHVVDGNQDDERTRLSC